MNKKNWHFLFLPILILTALSSLWSVLKTNFYFRDSVNMALKSHYLDYFHLLVILPVGITVFILALRKSQRAKVFILGLMSYLAFMFGFNALSLVLNEMFLVYVALFSLNICGLIMGYNAIKPEGSFKSLNVSIIVSGLFLLMFACTAYFSWVAEIVSSLLSGKEMEIIAGMNLPVSVTHVFDLGFALPAMMAGVILMYKKLNTGLVLSSVMAVFMLFISISLLVMETAAQYHGHYVDDGLLHAMCVLAPLSLFPLIVLFRALAKE